MRQRQDELIWFFPGPHPRPWTKRQERNWAQVEQRSKFINSPFPNSTYGYAMGWSASSAVHLQNKRIIQHLVSRNLNPKRRHLKCYHHLKFWTRWWRKKATSILASSDPGQHLDPPPKGVNLLLVWSWVWGDQWFFSSRNYTSRSTQSQKSTGNDLFFPLEPIYGPLEDSLIH